MQKTGCGKVNIIAHSKGGLDSRYAISKLGSDKYVASLTTINTPHHGCLFAEYLLNTAPEKFVKSIYIISGNVCISRNGMFPKPFGL